MQVPNKHGPKVSPPSNGDVMVFQVRRRTIYFGFFALAALPMLYVGLNVTLMEFNSPGIYSRQRFEHKVVPDRVWSAGNSTLLGENTEASLTERTDADDGDTTYQVQKNDDTGSLRSSLPLTEENSVDISHPNGEKERNLGCQRLKLFTSYQYWKSQETRQALLNDRIMIDGNPSAQQLLLSIPGCGMFYFKMSCRPTMSYFLGNQAWPEIVAYDLDISLGYNLTYPTVGIMLPFKALSKRAPKIRIARSCMHQYQDTNVLVGSIMRSATFKENQRGWYKDMCHSKNMQFMTELFKLNILDYLLLNNDRHMTKNWFRDGEHIVAVDNGAWSLNDDKKLCDRKKNLRTMLYPIKVFYKKTSSCRPLTSGSESPICTLTKLLSQTETIKSFLQSSWKGRRQFEAGLLSDHWFIHGPSLIRGQKGATGATRLGKILSRNITSCQKQIEDVGIHENSKVDTAEIVRFVSNEIEARYSLAQTTIRECLEK